MVQRVAAAWPALLLDGEDLARAGEVVACPRCETSGMSS
jgi:hypothetical protein